MLTLSSLFIVFEVGASINNGLHPLYLGTSTFQLNVYDEPDPYADPRSVEDRQSADKRIKAEIVDLIRDVYRKSSVRVTVFQGIVILKGRVDNKNTKEALESDVRKVQGVKNVNNFIEVKG